MKKYTKGKAYFFKFKEQYESIGGVCSYDNNGQVISIHDNTRSYSNISNTIIHEAVHYVTSRYIDEHPKIKAVLQGYVDYLREFDKKNKSKFLSLFDVYGFTNE
nr:MAG TPA: SprT-like domain-containing protein Spartan/DNA Complex repair, protease, DNA BINDING [Crassvirales sp.]